MARARRVRWECPTGEHPAVLGSTRPRADSIVRFCLPCSERAGRLVQRRAPALERRRAARATRHRERVAELRQRERDFRDEATRVEVADGWLHVPSVLSQMLALDEVQAVATSRTRNRMPNLTVRRRADGHVSGRAWPGERVLVSIGVGCSRERVEELLLHELLHYVLPPRTAHGSAFRKALVRAAREWFGVEVANEGRVYGIDDKIVEAAESKRTMERER